MAVVGKVTVGEWKSDAEGKYLDVRIRPAKEPVVSASGKSMLQATENVRLPNGFTLAVNLYEPKPRA